MVMSLSMPVALTSMHFFFLIVFTLLFFVSQLKQADVVVVIGTEHVTLPNTCFKPGVTLINCGPALMPGVHSSRTLHTFSLIPFMLWVCVCKMCSLYFILSYIIFLYNIRPVLCRITQRSQFMGRS